MIEFGGMVVASAVFAWFTLRRGSLTPRGAVVAVVIGWCVWYFAGLRWLVPLFLFFISSSLLGKLNKQEIAASDNRQGKARNAWQVICNGGVFAVLALFSVVFQDAPKLMLVSMAVANSDTWSSEVGMYFRQNTVDLLRWKRVSPGLSGGVSAAGTLGGLAGAVLIGACGFFLIPDYGIRACMFVSFAGFAGMLLDSIIGAGFQAKYYANNGGLSDRPGSELAGGFVWMSNDVVNLLSNAFVVASCALL